VNKSVDRTPSSSGEPEPFLPKTEIGNVFSSPIGLGSNLCTFHKYAETAMNNRATLHSASNTLFRSTKAINVITALAKAESEVDLNDEDREALQQGIDFLEKAKQGYELEEDITINEESKLQAEYFRAAFESWKQTGLTPQFINDIEDMQRLLRDIEENNGHVERATSNNTNGRIPKVKTFFRRVLQQDINSMKESDEQDIVKGLGEL